MTLRIQFYWQKIVQLCLIVSIGFWLNGCADNNATELPITSPNQTDHAVLTWSYDALTTLYNTNYVHYQQNLTKAQPYFTPEAWAAYQAALATSGNSDYVINNKLVVSLGFSGPLLILTKGLYEGRYIWQIQAPLIVIYQNADHKYQQNVLANMIIARAPAGQGINGIAISHIVLVPQTQLIEK